jgi:hypothetical protein
MSTMKELSLLKGEERFVFRYEPGGEENVLDAFVDLANERSSAFDWFDAAVLSFQLSKNLVEEAGQLLCPQAEIYGDDPLPPEMPWSHDVFEG